MKFFPCIASCLFLAACALAPAGDHEPGVGWSVYGRETGGQEQTGFVGYIISGRPEAVDEFTREALADRWSVEARAPASAELVLVQFRAPYRPDRTSSFMDRYLVESPRRLNIAPIVAYTEIP